MTNMLDYINTIKSTVSMRDVCDMYGLPVDRGGFTKCPFHSEKTGSMKIYPGDRGWHCFGCGEGGSVIDFAMKFFGLPLMDAVKKLNSDFNLRLPIGEKLSRHQEKEAARRAYQLRKEHEAKQRARDALDRRYQDALDLWVRYDTALTQKAPQSVTERLSDEYVEALQNVDRARYELEQAEEELYSFERGGA